MNRPKYRDLQGDRLVETATDDGARLRVIAGEAAGGRLVGPVEELTVAPQFIDVTLPPGGAFREAGSSPRPLHPRRAARRARAR